MNRLYSILIIILLACLHLNAQTERLYTVNAELPSSMITALAQDSVGNIWIGTENGLCRYDGAKFKTYSHNPNDSTSLLSNRVSALYVTSQGQILVGSQKGVQVFDPDYGTFAKVKLSFLDKDDIMAFISSIASLSDGSILISTLGNGVLSVDLEHLKAKSAVESSNAQMFTTALSVCPDNNLWLGNGRKGAMYAVWGPDEQLHLTTVSGTEGWKIEDIVTDIHGNAYYATQYGVYRISPTELTPQLAIEYNKKKILNLTLTNGSTMLIGTEGDGLLAYDMNRQTWADTGYNTGRTDISQARASALLIDRNNNLWLGLYQKGVLACKPQSNMFGYIGKGATANDLIGTNAVMSLYIGNDNTLWAVTDRDGIYTITDNNARHYPQGANGLPAMITKVYQSSDGSTWIGSIDTGLTRFNPVTGQCTNIRNFVGMGVFDIVEDRQGRLWIATMGEGLFCADKDMNILYKAPYTDQKHFTPGADLLNNRWINSLTMSNDGNKLFINTCYGVGCYDMEMGSFVNTFGQNHILEAKMCYDSYQDPDGYLWVATTDGIYRWHADNSTIDHFDTDDGLCNNSVVGITHDSNGNIWVSTLYGLSKLERSSEKISSYYVYDGIQGNEFTPRSMARSADGTIYAGGINGITIFDDTDRDTKTPRLRIADVYLHDQAINLASESNGKPIIRIKGNDRIYEFDSKDNSICVELTTDQFNNDNVKYLYSIDSGEWLSLQPRTNKLLFSNLSPGKHTIAVKACLYDTESDIEYLNINIRQHWYLSWWAILLYCGVISLALWGIYLIMHNRRQIKAQLAEQERKDSLNNTTMQFMTNVSREIRASISLISNPIDQLSELHDDSENNHLLSIIRNNINRILLLANQLRDVRKIDQGQMQLTKAPTEMVTYIRNATKSLEPVAQKRHVSLIVDAGHSPLYAMIDQYQFDKVIYNLLNNAINVAADNSQITVSVSTINNMVRICISDNDITISEQQLDKVFDRFYQNDNPHGYIHHSTGIGVHLSSLIVDLHEGSIKAVGNSNGQGVSIIIEMPVCNIDQCVIAEPTETTDDETDTQAMLQLGGETEYELTSKSLKSKPTIAIIESNTELRKYLHEQLQTSYNIMTFEKAKDALSEIRAKKPDMVIADTDHLDYDSISIVKNIRQNININDLPIIVLSAKNDDNDIISAIENGADYYITKPFKIKLLKSYIESLIVQRQRLKVIYQGSQVDDEIVTSATEIKTPDDQLMQRLARALDTNISNPNYTIEELASDVCMSRVHLNRKLKQLTNQSPSTYLRNMRLSKAAELLRENPGITVSDVATAVGMTSFSHFSHVFKELYGCTPSEYAQRCH